MLAQRSATTATTTENRIRNSISAGAQCFLWFDFKVATETMIIIDWNNEYVGNTMIERRRRSNEVRSIPLFEMG
jgi:hypothetical protein